MAFRTPHFPQRPPNGGETWLMGGSAAIKWASNPTGNVKVEYSVDGGGSWPSLANSVPNNGNLSVLVPNAPTLTVRVRVTNLLAGYTSVPTAATTTSVSSSHSLQSTRQICP